MKTLSARNATTEKKLCSIGRDNIDTKNFWISVSRRTVTLTEQTNGEKAKSQITIPKKDFNKFVDFYNREQKIIRK